jgi:hypothetical protein
VPAPSFEPVVERGINAKLELFDFALIPVEDEFDLRKTPGTDTRLQMDQKAVCFH